MHAEQVSVLIVEDNLGDARLVAEMLRDVKHPVFKVSAAPSLVEAFESLSNESFDAILLDLSLPDSQGLETFTRVQAEAPDVPVVVLTGLNDDALGLRAVSQGAQDYLVKGQHDGNRLGRALSFAIERNRTQAELMKLSLAVEQSASIVIITDIAGNIDYVNAKFTEVSGYSQEEARSHNPRIVKSGTTPAEVYETMWDAILSGREWHGELCNRKKNGDLYWVISSISPIKNARGDTTQFLAIQEDVSDQIAMEEALKESQHFAQATLDSLTAHIAVVEEDGTIIAVNDAWREFAAANAGDPEKMCEGANYFAAASGPASPEDAETAQAFVNAMQAVLKGEQNNFLLEYPCHSPDEERWFEGRVTRYGGAGTPRITVSHMDITQRVQASRQLEANNKKLSLMNRMIGYVTSSTKIEHLLALACQGLVSYLKCTGGVALLYDADFTEARIVASFAQHRFGSQHDVAIPLADNVPFSSISKSLTPIRITDSQNDPRVAPIMATTLVNGATSALWLPIGSLGTKSGIKGALYLYANRAEQLSQEVFESTSQVARAISPAIDNSILHQQVVEQNLRLEALVKERTDQLQRVNDRLNAILSHISDGIVLVRDDGSIDVTNYAFDQKLGAAEDAYFGLPLEDIADDTDQDALRQLAADVLTDGHPRQIEITVCPKDAARFDADVSVARVLEGGQTFAICSIHDISHLKEVERLKSDFVSNVSHDLRTPVAGMLLNLSTLQGYYERLTEEKRLEKIKQAHAQVKTLAEMVDGILDLSRIEARGKARSNELVDIVAAAREIVTELEPSATAKQQHIILSTLHSEMIVPGEHGDFARIWRNLVGNATKYSPNSCSIRLHLGLMAKTNGKIHLSENLLPSQFDVPPDLNEGSYFVGQVQDEGYGIPVEDFKDLFTRFHRGWAKTGSIAGSGLGLSVVFELLKFYGGGIHVTSKPEEGSLFTFWLPGHQESRKVQV